MAGNKQPRRASGAGPTRLVEVEVEDYDVTMRDAVFLDDGYAIPPTFTVIADFKNEPLRVTIRVEIESKRARPREVCVSTDRPGGVSSTTLRSVPIRDVMASGCKKVLHKVAHKTGTSFALEMPGPYGHMEIAAIEQLVGYVEVEP